MSRFSSNFYVFKILSLRNCFFQMFFNANQPFQIGPRAFKNLKIKKLTLDNNKIKNIHRDAFKGLETVLMELSISGNRLPLIPTESLEGLRALNVLSLKCNQIENLNYTAFVRMPSLIEVNLACNQVKLGKGMQT